MHISFKFAIRPDLRRLDAQSIMRNLKIFERSKVSNKALVHRRGGGEVGEAFLIARVVYPVVSCRAPLFEKGVKHYLADGLGA